MPVFTYKALKEDGSADAGVIDADTPKEARLKLRGRKLHVTDLESVEEKEARQQGIRAPIFRRKRVHEIGIITRQIATLLNAGIPIMGALSAIIEQTDAEDLKATMMDIRERVATGGTFSDALEMHSFYFSDLYVNMVRAGEAAGNLDKVMFRVADFLQSSHRMKAKIMTAMTYPTGGRSNMD